jgi:hypothetical protein
LKAVALAALLVPSLAAAAPQMGWIARAVAMKRAEPRKLAPEENPRLGGASKAFAKARVRIDSPGEREQLSPGDVVVRLSITGYALVGGAHAHLIVDNEPALQVDDASQPLTLKGVSPGPHLLRVVLCRPWHEVVKAPRAFAMVRFWSGARTAGRAATTAEHQIWPTPGRPLLTYVLPLGQPRPDGPHLDGAAPAASSPSSSSSSSGSPASTSTPTAPSVPATFTSVSTDPNLGGSDGTPPPPLPPTATPPAVSPFAPTQPAQVARRPRPLALDFYLSNARLSRRSYKVYVELDRAELQLVKSWDPRRLPRLHPGRHHIIIDLLDHMAQQVHGPVNRTSRTFHTP